MTCSFLSPALLCAGDAPKTAVQNYTPKPAIWKLADSDTTIFLFGTTHALPKGFRWQTPTFKNIVKLADELVLESLNTPDGDKASSQTITDISNPHEKRPPLAGRIASDMRPALNAAIAQTPFPSAFFDMMPTWMATFTLVIADMGADGQVKGFGVEAALEKAFRSAHKPIGAVEDGNAILQQLNRLSEGEQVQMLEEALSDIVDETVDQNASNHAWAQGDVDMIAKEFTEADMGVGLYDILLRRRNQAWTLWLERRLERPGVVLFAVGAGHLSGADSVQMMLYAKGLKVMRIQ